MRHGGKVLIDQLKIQGVRRVFCIPGESYLAALDGLFESNIETIVGRHEGGVTMMAEAYGKLTGKPGVAFVTRGPGATNACSGVHVAFQDSTPLVLLIGQVASDQRDREAFQEIEYRKMFEPLAKWVAEIDRADRIPEYIARAFSVACSGRPGPVVLALPEDILSADCSVKDANPVVDVNQGAHLATVKTIIEKIARAKRPFCIVGGSKWSQKAANNLEKLSERMSIPVGTSFRCQDFMDNRHPNYMGDVGLAINPKLGSYIKSADLILCVGARLGENTTGGYSLLEVPNAANPLIHVHPDPDELGRVYTPEISLACNSFDFLESALEQSVSVDRDLSPLRKNYYSWREPYETPGSVKMEQIVLQLNEVLAEDAIVANGAGNYAAWLHRYFQYKSFKTQLAPTSGSMGYGIPAAISAKLERPNTEVVCLAGDGCAQMSIQEFGTAVQYKANIIIIISNNGVYGTIKMHQERTYPGRTSGTNMLNPDFASLARSYGGFGETVEKTAEFLPAFERARSAGKPAIIDLKTNPLALSPQTSA
ncbi:MAG: thiamine pyrophosphate-binding protein [Paracoccaceae bacterium]